jgi:ankyrin repeat protein
MKLKTFILSIAAFSQCALLCATEAQSPAITREYAQALRSGDVRQLRAMLDKGAPVNGRDAAGNTPLMQAAAYGDLACMRLLVERGAEVNVTNAAGSTPLMRAAHDFKKTRELVAHGAIVNVNSALGNTPLMLAARPCNSHRTVELLLAHGADANATNFSGANALMAAAAGGDAETVRLLLARGVDANAQPGIGQPQFIFGGGRSALMWASFRGDIGIMKLLLDAGANPNGEGMLGTPLQQAAWANQTEAARLLIERGAQVKQTDHFAGYSALHWAASTEEGNPALLKLLLSNGADPNAEGGQNIDAFMDVPQTPLMLAHKRGETAVLSELLRAGATNETPDKVRAIAGADRNLPDNIDAHTLRAAISKAMPLLQQTSVESKKSFVKHTSRQDCVSCHQQHLPLAAIGAAKRAQVSVDQDEETELANMVRAGELKNPEADWQALFHPDGVQTKGHALFGYAMAEFAPDAFSDAAVHHLASVQGKDGRWFNNLPRPPIQTGDVGATALAINALQRYALPGQKAQFAKQVEKARQWLWTVKPQNNDNRVYQILGLAWAGESAEKLAPLAKALIAEQRKDGGWAQLPGLKSDAFATGQAVYALRTAGKSADEAVIQSGRRYLLQTQLEDGTWYVHRRAFPFQPTMSSGFPHGKDSWISAAATSWAVLALSEPAEGDALARK